MLLVQNDSNLTDEEHPDGRDMSDGDWGATSDSESDEGCDCSPTASTSTCMLITQNNHF